MELIIFRSYYEWGNNNYNVWNIPHAEMHWMNGKLERSPLSSLPYLGVSRLYCFTFYGAPAKWSRRKQIWTSFITFFSLLLHWRCWKIMNCDEISYCRNVKKSQRCSFAQFELEMKSQSSNSPETVKGCWLLLFGLFFSGVSAVDRVAIVSRQIISDTIDFLLDQAILLRFWAGQSVLRGSLSVCGWKKKFQVADKSKTWILVVFITISSNLVRYFLAPHATTFIHCWLLIRDQ